MLQVTVVRGREEGLGPQGRLTRCWPKVSYDLPGHAGASQNWEFIGTIHFKYLHGPAILYFAFRSCIPIFVTSWLKSLLGFVAVD